MQNASSVKACAIGVAARALAAANGTEAVLRSYDETHVAKVAQKLTCYNYIYF